MSKLADTSLYIGFAALILSGCSTPSTVETVPVSDVLNALKSELNNIHPTAELPPDQTAGCSDPDHVVRVVAYPTKAVVDLKTVVTAEIDASGSANVPVGPSGVILSPSVGGSSTNINTQDLKLTLPIQHSPPTRADLQSEIASLRKYVQDRKTSLKDLNGATDKDGQLALKQIQSAIDVAQKKLNEDDIALAKIESKGPTPYPQPHPFIRPIQTLPLATGEKVTAMPVRTTNQLAAPQTGHVDFTLPIAEAFNKAILGILETNHTPPCFLPQQMDITVNFEAVKQVQGGLTVTFLVAKIGGNASNKDDATQSITVTFDLSDGSLSPAGSSGNSGN